MMVKGNNDVLTKQLIGSIYHAQDISKFRFDMIRCESDLVKFTKQKFFTSINFCGSNSLLVFTRIAGKHYCFTVDRHTLSYNFAKVDYSKVQMEQKNISLDYDIYHGTIFDGILTKMRGRNDIFTITDVYTFRGTNYVSTKLDEKLKMVESYLRQNYVDGHIENTLDIAVSQIYPIQETRNVVNNILPKIKDVPYRGLCFYPEYTDTKLIFIFNKNGDDDKSNKQDNENSENNDESNDVNKKKAIAKNECVPVKETKYRYVNTGDTDVYATLEIKKTENIDVYNLYAVERKTMDNMQVLKRVPMGIAYIAGIKQSHKIRNIFNNQNKKVLMKCKFNENKSKWEPLDIDDVSKHPTLMENINLVMMEMSDDES